MKRRLDIFAHGFLYAGFVIGALAIYFSRFDSMRQFTVILLLVAFYLVWGFLYHYIRKDAEKKLLLEYLVIAAIAVLSAVLVLVI